MNRQFMIKSVVFCMIAAAISTFYSCGGFMGIDILDQESIDSNLKPKLVEILGEDVGVLEIRLSEGGGTTFSTTIVGARVEYFEPGSDELKSKWITLEGKTEGKDMTVLPKASVPGRSKPTSADTQKLGSIDFSKIASIVNKAGKMVEDAKDEFSGVHSYCIKMNADPAKVVHTFAIQSRQGSKTTTKSGRLATEISYVEYEFEADAAGNVTMKE